VGGIEEDTVKVVTTPGVRWVKVVAAVMIIMIIVIISCSIQVME